MKLDRIAFARLVAIIQQLITRGENLDNYIIQDLDELCTIEEPQKIAVTVADLETLLSAHSNSRKIDAIKSVRSMTGLGLKEAKDLVERHPLNPTNSTADLKKRMINKIEEQKNCSSDTQWFTLHGFSHKSLDEVKEFIESF